jgi:hypothetical protein
MAYGLLGITMLFCAVVGHTMAVNNSNLYAVLVFTVAAIFSLQTSFIVTLVLRSLMEGNHS